MENITYKIGRKNVWHSFAHTVNNVLHCPGLKFADFHNLSFEKAKQILIDRGLYLEEVE